MTRHRSDREQYSDRELAERYTNQPARLPDAVRARLLQACDGEPLLAYALVDLDERLALVERWVALTRHWLVCIEAHAPDGARVERIARGAITGLSTDAGLSCRVIRVHGAGGPLLVLRHTQRQRASLEVIQFALSQALEGREVPLGDPDETYLSGIVQPIRDAQALIVPHRLAVVWRLLGYLKPYRTQVCIGMAAAFGITGLALVPPYITGYLVDEVITPVQAGRLDPNQISASAWWAVAGIAVVQLLRQACAGVRLRLMAVLGEYVARDLREELYAHLQRLSIGFFSRKKTGSLITRVSSDTDRLWDFLAFGVVEVSLSIIMLTGLSAVLISLDWRLGLAMTLPVPVFCYAIWRHGQTMNHLFSRAWRKWSAVTDVVSDTIPGMRVVKAFNQEARERRRFSQRNHDVVGEFRRIHAVWTSFWPLLMLAVQATIVLVWVLALPRLLGGEPGWLGPKLSVGTFVAFLLYTSMFAQPIEIIGQMARIMNRATSSAHRVFEVLDTEPELVDKPTAKRLTRLEGGVHFDNVTFAYDGVRQVIKGISFEVRPGELVGLVGPSGGGKTTLTHLLTRFYDVTSGSIRIDGVDLRDLDSEQFRRQVGMVLQEPYLFHGTIADNIRYGMPEAGFAEVVEAARAANAHDFVCRLPQGYETLVGERGHNLSGGERQRISIARAILRDPRILILDEATSAVDTETERKIQEALDRLVAGRTVFAIAHRLSTLRQASRLLVIKDGRLEECGTHAELLAKPGGIYRKLYELQLEVHDAA